MNIREVGGRAVPCRRQDGPSDMTKLIVAFGNVAKESKKPNSLTCHCHTSTANWHLERLYYQSFAIIGKL